MSNYDINSNSALTKQMLKQYEAEEEELRNDPDSVLLAFKQELLDSGFKFHVLNQAEGLMPKYKDEVLPIAIKYYKAAKTKNEKRYLMKWFQYRGLEELVPMLLSDFYSDDRTVDRWQIGSILYHIRSKKYIDDYLKIISESAYGRDRQMVVQLVGKLKIEAAVPILIELLEDESVRLHAISALSDFKREEFRPYFERFQSSKHPGWRRYAKNALKKLDAQCKNV